MHDYIVCYAKDADSWERNLLPRTEKQNKAYRNLDNDLRGPWKAGDLSARNYPMLAVSRKRVQTLFERLGLMDARVRFVEGWFNETLVDAPIGPVAVLRLDGDYYESTMTPLRALYDRVSPGGFVIVDDYGLLEPARRAVDEFRAEQRISAPLNDIDGHGHFWRKPG